MKTICLTMVLATALPIAPLHSMGNAAAPAAPAPSLAERCASNPALFNAKTIGRDEIDKYIKTYSSDFAKVLGGGTSFALSGVCNPTIRSLKNGVHLTGGRSLLTSEPPFQLVVNPEQNADSDGDAAQPPIASDLRTLSPSAPGLAGPLRFKDGVALPDSRAFVLWSNSRGSVIAVTQCQTGGKCLPPRPLVVSKYQVKELGTLPLPDNRASVALQFWVHIDQQHDAQIALIVGK